MFMTRQFKSSPVSPVTRIKIVNKLEELNNYIISTKHLI